MGFSDSLELRAFGLFRFLGVAGFWAFQIPWSCGLLGFSDSLELRAFGLFSFLGVAGFWAFQIPWSCGLLVKPRKLEHGFRMIHAT